MASNGTSLRRSCQACVKVKRRCDLLFPDCTRCVKKGVRCQYVNVPLSGQQSSQVAQGRISKASHDTSPSATSNHNNGAAVVRHSAQSTPSPTVDNRFEIEVLKARSPDIIDAIVQGMRNIPVLFAQGMQSVFIHPCLYGKSLPAPVRDVHAICSLYLTEGGGPCPSELHPLLQRQVGAILRAARTAATFEDLLACVQALTVAQCLQMGDRNFDMAAVERTNNLIVHLARKLWEQAPYQLPSTMSPWRAWLFGESVRRTIIFAHVVYATYSLMKCGYALRTPFVDALPFDMRTWLWEVQSEDTWSRLYANTATPMVSLYEFCALLASEQMGCFSTFEGILVAACKGKELPLRDPGEMLTAC